MKPALPHPRQRGFTLIELLIVVAIIGILIGLALPGLLTALDRSKQTSSAALLRAFGESLEVYGTDNHVYPAVTSIRDLMPHLRPYSDSLRPDDAWKHEVVYTTDGENYTVECLGKDGLDGDDISPQNRYNFTLDLVFSNGNWVAWIE